MEGPIMFSAQLIASPLGKTISYPKTYDPSLLFPIPRREKRVEMEIAEELPFNGVDIWHAYELSWLNSKGKPQIAMATLRVPCSSPNLIESKSLKIYLNSFNQTRFATDEDVKLTMERDLSAIAGAPVNVMLITPDHFGNLPICPARGQCLDTLDIDIDMYSVTPDFLKTIDREVEEHLHSNLLKSNCPCTGQPDWATIEISYSGPQIDHEGLLKYLVSFRDHNDFHEQTIERIFLDIQRQCHPKTLTVFGRYTRRGGLDINPFRTNCAPTPTSERHPRQ